MEARGEWRVEPVGAVMARLGLPDGAAGPVGGYLTRLDVALPVSRRQRNGVLAEVGDGIACAVEQRMLSGETAAAAARTALAQLGDPEELATAMAVEIAPLTAHRTGLLLLFGGPVVGLAWIASGQQANGLWERIETAMAAVPMYPMLLAVAVPAALIAVAGAGLLSRRWPAFGDLSVRAALWAGVACMAGDAMLLFAATSVDVRSTWLAVAVGASLLRLTTATIAVRRIARLNAVVRHASA